MVKVSVIMPSLNVKPYIKECIESVINQTLKDIEIICVDAGSTDGTLEILEEYGKKDSRIKIIHSDKKSYGHQMNIGIANSTGEYIGIVETDDYIKSTMYEDLYKLSENGTIDIIKANFWHFNEFDENPLTEDRTKINLPPENESFTIKENANILHGHPSIWAGIYNKNFLEKNNIKFMEAPGGGWVDNPFLFETFCLAKTIRYKDEPYYYYRESNPNSSTNTISKNLNLPIERMMNNLDILEKYNYFDEDILYFLYVRIFWHINNDILAKTNFKDNEEEVSLNIKKVVNRMDSRIIKSKFNKENRTIYNRFKYYSEPKISIIMPIYNGAEYLEQAISSITKQTLKDIELICIDDGSTDGSLEILEKLAKKYDYIKVHSQKNQGSGKARNFGMKIAKGQYIGFLDADDYFIDNDALERLYNTANANDANMTTGNILHDVDNPGEFIPFKHLEYYTKDKVILPEEYGLPWSFYKSIFNKDFLIDNEIYFPDLLRGQDPVWLAEILSKIDKIYAVSSDVYAYVFYDAINRCDVERKLYDQLLHYKLVFDYLDEPRFNKSVEDFKRAFFWFIDHLDQKDIKYALTKLREIFKDDKYILYEIEEHFYLKYKDNKELLDKLNLNKTNPKISVIIPVYKAEEFLDEAINSVLNQTFEDIELVCVNDGSPDNSLEMLNEFAKKDPRVKVIDQENSGCGAARNKSLDNAVGDYIYFFDPDDYILPNTFKELYKNAVTNDSDFVIFKIARFVEKDNIDYSNPGFEFEKVFEGVNFNKFTFTCHDIKSYVLNSSFAPWTKLYKKEFLDSYDDFRFDLGVAFDDVPFHVKSMLRAKKISYIPEFFYHYRFNPNSVNNTSSNGIDIFKICDLVEEFLKKESYYDEYENEFKLFKITQIINYLISTDSEEYYQLAREEFSKIQLSDNFKINKNLLKQYNLVLKFKTFKEFKLNDYSIKIKSLEKENKKLNKENKKLNKKLKKVKKQNKKLINSNSWKITKPIRSVRNKIRK